MPSSTKREKLHQIPSAQNRRLHKQRFFIESMPKNNMSINTTYRVRPKNVPRQKLRFLKNRCVNLHVIFTHCKERICTLLTIKKGGRTFVIITLENPDGF